MAAAPLIDFDALDLTEIRIPMEDVRTVCKQRNRFEMLDGILHFELGGDVIVGFKDIRGDDWWAADHIPGRPIFPGALQCEGAAQLCTYDFMRRHPELEGAFVGFAGMNRTRFRGIVEPPSKLIWAGQVKSERSRMFTYYAQGFIERKMVFETEIMGMVL